MAKETVQAVRQAELNAAQIERDAVLQKEAMISDAGLNAKTLITSMTKQAMEKAEQDLAAAVKRGNQMLEEAKTKADNEVLLMKEMALMKEEAAVNLILSNVIHGS